MTKAIVYKTFSSNTGKTECLLSQSKYFLSLNVVALTLESLQKGWL